MTEMQEYLALNSWLADNCQFAMDYIMPEMVEPEPGENQLYTYAYNCMYNMIKQQVYKGTYDAVYDQVYNGALAQGADESTAKAQAEQQAEQIATAQADAYMVDVQENDGSGEQQAASTASAIVGMWGSNPVGVFVNKKAVCFGYANVYAYLLQCAHPEIYLKDGATDIDTASNWKSYKELNYELDSDGNPVKDENGNYKWSENSAAIADYVKIVFDANVSMFGEKSTFGETHYWNAVKLNGQWYYVDPCYVDIYIECMNRDRVETDGNLNHLYFMFSDDSCRDMYKDNFAEIRTLYEGIATDDTYEGAWVAFVKSQPYKVGDKIYYLYDSTDLLAMMGSDGDSGTDYESMFTDTEYKIVYHTDAMGDDKAEFSTLIDFNNGQVYVPAAEEGAGGGMVDNALLKKLYEEHQEYVKEYPSISISCAYYNDKIYFSLSNCVLSYDLGTGTVEKLIEYTEVSGTRDMTKGLGGMAFAMTSGDPGENGITVKNPPIADMTIKRDGKMYVSVATNYAFISGKDHGQIKDYSSYGYKFAETNYEPSYNTYYNNSEPNDNDEFMWSANIVGTIGMDHLTGTAHNYENVTVPASCTEDEYTVNRCSECGLIQETAATEEEAETVNEGEETEDNDVTEEGEDQAEEKTNDLAVLNITVKASEEENAQIIASTTLTAKEEVADDTDEPTTEAEATQYTFSGDEISNAVKALSLPEGYGIPEDYNAADVSVAYGESGNTSVIAALTAESAPEVAALNIEVKASTEENAQVIASATLTSVKSTEETPIETASEEGTSTDEAGTSVEFTAENINTVISGFAVDGYVMPKYEGESVLVKYGESRKVDLVATAEIVNQPEKADATIEIKVYDSATKESATPEVVVEKTITKSGSEGGTLVYTPGDIIAEVSEEVKAKGYTLDKNQLTNDIKAVYGGDPVTVELTATETPMGKGHVYIKFNETYYTKDDSGNWQTGVSYVCIDCGHAFELEDGETVEDHLGSNDKVLTDDEVAAYAGTITEVWTWSTDKTEASMYTVPTELMSHKFDCIWENPSLSTREVAAVSGDCTTGKFTATLTSGKTETGSTTVGNHSYLNKEETEKDEDGNETVTQEAAVQWTWADDLSTATVSFLCDVCGNKTTVEVSKDDNTDAKKMAVESTAATCTENGSDKYTATVVVDGVNYISSRTVETDPATGHTYGEDGKCTVCGEEKPTVDAPVISSVYSKLQTTAKVTWNKVDGAVGYELWRATSMDAADDEWSRVKTIKGDDVEKYTFAEDDTIRYTNVDLTVGQTYFYKVRAFKLTSADVDIEDETARNYSEFSAIKYMPAAVVFDNVYSNSTSRIRILWEEVDGAHGYQVWRKTDDGEYAIVKTIGDKDNKLTDDQGATTAYSNTGLESGKTYTYKMRAFSIPEEGTKVFGAYSDEVTVAVMPETPVVSVKSSNAGKATISWDPVNGAAGYQIWMAGSEDGTYDIVKSITDGTAKSYTKDSLESGKTYFFKVRAYTEVEGNKTFGAYSESKNVTVK